jgi:hypothetical protein
MRQMVRGRKLLSEAGYHGDDYPISGADSLRRCYRVLDKRSMGTDLLHTTI